MSSEYDIAALIGRDRFLKLQLRKAGKRIYIPAVFRVEHELTMMLGMVAAKSLSDALGGELIHISRGALVRERNRSIRAMRTVGMPADQIGKIFGLKARTIRGIVQGISDEVVLSYGVSSRRLMWFEQREQND